MTRSLWRPVIGGRALELVLPAFRPVRALCHRSRCRDFAWWIALFAVCAAMCCTVGGW